jgi:hypothetical protein
VRPPGSIGLPGLHLGILDLLEDLAHARTHQVASGRLRVLIPPPDAGGLALVELVAGGFVGHDRIVSPLGAVVNALVRALG